jgi:hypothetical protein
MEIVRHTGRWLLHFIPAATVALSSIGPVQAGDLSPKKDAMTSYSIALTSLIPHAPMNKKGVSLDVKAGERVAVRQYLGLPLIVEMDPCPRDVQERTERLARVMPEFRGVGCSTVHLLDEQGREIKEVNIGNSTSVPFVDQRLLVFLWKAT